jgi:hypothetical protein
VPAGGRAAVGAGLRGPLHRRYHRRAELVRCQGPGGSGTRASATPDSVTSGLGAGRGGGYRRGQFAWGLERDEMAGAVERDEPEGGEELADPVGPFAGEERIV